MFRSFENGVRKLRLKFIYLLSDTSNLRRLFLVLISVCIIFYVLPPVFRYLFMTAEKDKEPLLQCMDDRLTAFFLQNMEYDSNILHDPPLSEERKFIPYIGNGYFGMEVKHDASINIKSGRSMQIIPLFPVVSVASEALSASREATVTEYLTGIVHRFQCFSKYFVSYTYYAHRTHPSILMQEIKITNTHNALEEVQLILPRINLKTPAFRNIKLGNPSTSPLVGFKEFDVITGTVAQSPEDPQSKLIAVTAVLPKIPTTMEIKKRGTSRLIYPIAIQYSKAVNSQQLKEAIEETEGKAIKAMTAALQKLQSQSDDLLSRNAFRQDHINVWAGLWSTGFSISTSKAENSLNGDRINATMYAVLAQARAFESEEFTSASMPGKQEIIKAITYAEGCYDSYHTLQAENLWLIMDSLESLNNVVHSWMLTLEKQGCHNLIRAGASGIMQAMVLSFGSFRFNNQHLECNMHPKYLHRDFHFRRLNYGNKTHLNISITVTEDNKAVINVALDRSDRSYYACDAGCLDDPILLTQHRRQFPVKLTDPLTAILYITEDKQHMTELHEAIHVKEVGEAPAHEQHVIALHKHGHQLGGLPTLFWVSVCAIIIVFHVFLCKLIVKEYCESPEKIRYRYNNKP